MRKYTGKSVYGSVVVGKVSLPKRKTLAVKRVRVEDIETEKQRLEEAKRISVLQLCEIYRKALVKVGEANASIFEIHIMLVDDEDYNESVYSILESQRVNAEYAVAVTADNFAQMFAAMEDSYMRARAADVRDISDRLIANLLGDLPNIPMPAETENGSVICACDLAPSEAILLDTDKVSAFVAAQGSSNSHAAILARNMGIPVIFGAGEEFLSEIENGEEIIVDGYTGEIYLEPDEETRAFSLEKQLAHGERKRLLTELKGKDNVTLDGRRINICANIGGVDNIGEVLLNDAGGIGLFRSEFICFGCSQYPTEEQQLAVYRRVIESMAGKRVIIRTLDIGADKRADFFGLEREENPALGYRGIRVSLERPELFKIQLRALYRASVFGRLGIMFPMITSVGELSAVLDICGEVKRELKEQGVNYSENVETGIMIETPAAALISDRLAPMVDFFGLGTNDLIQYTLACDRENPNMEKYSDPHHEAVMRLIEMSARNAHENGAWVGICGELAADTTLTEAFIRMGIDELSVAPSMVLKVRDTVRKLDLSV
ncbi:MAG: phosphoenolpyruvate--protein phosphotransferase [Oscillospiraceae bacterium]|nr:phosphoenolpyruvate--protein phosphotransferase [Oscillospiraceae bacterium]